MTKRSLAVWLLKGGVTAGLLCWLFSNPEIRAGLAGLRLLTPGWLLLGFAAAGFGQVLEAARWRVCLRTAGVGLPFLTVLRITLISTAAGLLSLGPLGADAVKVLLAGRRCPGQRVPLVASLGLDHASAFPAFVIMALFVISALGSRLTVGKGAWLALGVAVAVFFAVGLVLRRFHPEWHGRLRRFLLEVRTRQGFAEAALLSVPLLFLHFLLFYCAARALGVVVPVVKFVGAAAVADLAAALPVSIAGLGVREKAFVSVLGAWHGVSPAQAIGLSLAGLGLILCWALVGVICFLAEPVLRKPEG
jgi:uncharacterized membrane protein YbhN (UPF0104 family)